MAGMTTCLLCRRSLMVGERYRMWRSPDSPAERPVCRLCEELAEEIGWVRLDMPLQREKGSLIWHARKVA